MSCRVLVGIALAVGGVGLAGCGSATLSAAPDKHVVSSTSASSTIASSTFASPPPVREQTFKEGDNGRTVTVNPGDRLAVQLGSTYWRFAADTSSPGLREVGQPVYAAVLPPKCVPGGGCGTVTATFQAVSTGRAVVIAGRTVCGEAMACVPNSPASDYRLTVIVR